MNAPRTANNLALAALFLAAISPAPAFALANRVFVSARSGNNLNSCDNVTTPCQTFAGAVLQLNPDGEVIVLDSGGYGPVTITQGVTIAAPAGVTAFIHPPSGNAITINAGSDVVTLRGLTLNDGTSNGILVNSVGTLNVESSFITGFAANGIRMSAAGRLNIKETDIKGCANGFFVSPSTGMARISFDHCHLDGNQFGYAAGTESPGSSTTGASNTTANNNKYAGWFCGGGSSGKDVLDLEFCTASENGDDGVTEDSANANSGIRLSNCVLANNSGHGVGQYGSGSVRSRGNNTIVENTAGGTTGTIDSFSPQ